MGNTCISNYIAIALAKSLYPAYELAAPTCLYVVYSYCIQTKDLAYRALVRPQLEYTSVVWSQWQQGISALIEKVYYYYYTYFTVNTEGLEATRANSPKLYMIVYQQ